MGQTAANPGGLGPCKLGEVTNDLLGISAITLDILYGGVIDLIIDKKVQQFSGNIPA